MPFLGNKSPNSEVSWTGPLAPVSSSSRETIPSRPRRTQGSSESRTPLFGDEEIWNEDYRCGGPSLARLPVVNQQINRQDPLETIWNSILEAPVKEILNQWEIHVKSTGPIRRAHSPLEVREGWKDTILITAQKHTLDDSWYKACKSIRKTFSQNGFVDLNIEIIDPRASEPTLTYPILSDDPFIAIWAELRLAVLIMLEGKDWVLLSVLRRGKADDDEKRITICITIREESDADWNSAREGTIALLDARKLYNVAIEIYRGQVGQASTLIDNDISLAARDWRAPAKFGGSLGPRGPNLASSTFGGFLEIQLPSGEWRRMGMTTYDCIFGSQKFSGTFHDHGIRPENAPNTLELEHPADEDYERSIIRYRAEIASLEAATPEQAKKRVREGDPTVSRGIKIGYERQMERIKDIQSIVDTAQFFHGHDQHFLGKVYAGSGYRLTDNGMILDWACIDVRRERMGRNEIPQEHDVPMKHRATYYGMSLCIR